MLLAAHRDRKLAIRQNRRLFFRSVDAVRIVEIGMASAADTVVENLTDALVATLLDNFRRELDLARSRWRAGEMRKRGGSKRRRHRTEHRSMGTIRYNPERRLRNPAK